MKIYRDRAVTGEGLRSGITQYVALGDSMTISDYPAVDAESLYGRGYNDLGAGALLFRNNDELFPEFRGRDLSSRIENISFLDLATDGATLPTVESQLDNLPESARIITLTVGGNDLLSAYWSARSTGDLSTAVDRIRTGYERQVSRLRRASTEALIILNTVYDPTDGTGTLPGSEDILPIEQLHRFHDTVRDVASKTEHTVLADVHAHFLGHGITAPPEERWYWNGSIIEPGVRGASEIRRLWIEAVEGSNFR
jgi:lysophospholipase L1-like esterase